MGMGYCQRLVAEDVPIRLITIHRCLAAALVWLPVGVLYTEAQFGLAPAILLPALYYLFVVAFEVPSGWLSDRIGRVLALRVAAIAFCAAYVCFILGEGVLAWFVAGEALIAVGFASLSGTDVAYFYDTLEMHGLADEFPERQARLTSLAYTTTAVSVLVGGAVGLIDLRLAYVVSLGLAIGQVAITFWLPEPQVATEQAARFGRQLSDVTAYLRKPFLRWIFLYGVAMVTLEHVAFAIVQPWLKAALGNTSENLGWTPLVSGVLFAVVAAVGALAARGAVPAAARFGLVRTLVGLGALSAVIVATMAATTSVAVLALVSMRSVQGAAAPVLISSAVSPETEPQHRATLLSLNSLAGRLGFGLVLLAVSPLGSADEVGPVAVALTVVSWVLVAVIATSGRRHRDEGTGLFGVAE